MTCPDPKQPQLRRARRPLRQVQPSWWDGLWCLYPRRWPDSLEMAARKRTLVTAAVGLVAVSALAWAGSHVAPLGPTDAGAQLAAVQMQDAGTPEDMPQLSDIGPAWTGTLGYGRVPAPPSHGTPVAGQKAPECLKGIEVEINGGCWWPHTAKPRNGLCPDPLYEHEGACYGVVLAKARPPSSIDGGSPR